MADLEVAEKKVFYFESGRRLEQQSEGVPLKELFRSFSGEVLEVVDSEGLAIVGGESGLGKSELFLSNTRLKINAGGIVCILKERDKRYKTLNFQSFAGDENSSLLRDIADLTGGEYMKAYTPMDIVSKFNQFLIRLKANSKIYVKRDIVKLAKIWFVMNKAIYSDIVRDAFGEDFTGKRACTVFVMKVEVFALQTL